MSHTVYVGYTHTYIWKELGHVLEVLAFVSDNVQRSTLSVCMVGSSPRWVTFSQFYGITLRTHTRGIIGVLKAPQLDSGSGRTGQAAGVSWLDDLLPSEPRAWASQPRRSPAVAAGWTARAPACLHEVAAGCHLTAIESSFHRRSRQPPATHRVQPVVRLRCGQEAHAGGGCGTCLVDVADWRGMASTATMVPKDCSRSGRRRAAHLPAHQRCRRMDSTSHVWGPSHRRAQQLQRWPMRFVSPPAW